MGTTMDLKQVIPEDNILFGVPKKGRLYERCLELLNGSGLRHIRVSQLSA